MKTDEAVTKTSIPVSLPVRLYDDGTLDTVVTVGGVLVRFSPDYAAEWRDPDTGELDLKRFTDDNADELVDAYFEYVMTE